jgi:hypothetical protein
MITGQLVHEKVESHITENMEYHGTATSHQANTHAIKGPLADHGKGCLKVFILHTRSFVVVW